MDDSHVSNDDNWSDNSSEGSVDGAEEEDQAGVAVDCTQFQWIFTKSCVTDHDLTKSEPLLPAITCRWSVELER